MIDYHIHTARCGHAQGQIKEYYEEACRKGLEEIGFADHFPLDLLGFVPPVKVTMEGKELSEYIEDVFRLQNNSKNPKVKLGIEVDFLPGSKQIIRKEIHRYHFDYVIGSVHFLENWDFTNPESAHRYNKLSENEILRLYEKYYEIIEKSIKSGLFDIIGHIDVIKKFGYRPVKNIHYLLDRVSDLLREADLCMEVNTSGFYAPAEEFYPGVDMLKLCYNKRIPVTLGSDAHRPADVGRDLKKAAALLKEIGYREIAVFKGRKRSCLKLA